MAEREYLISRDLLEIIFKNPRARAQFERFQAQFKVVDDQSTAAVAATTDLLDASFLTLSANAALRNERVATFGDGLRYHLSDGGLLLETTVRAANHYNITLTAPGDVNLGLPASGMLATVAYVDSVAGGGGGGGTFFGLDGGDASNSGSADYSMDGGSA